MDHAPSKRRRIHKDFLRIVDEYVRRLTTIESVCEAVETATTTEIDLALRKAVLADDLELVNLLLENGADPDTGLTEPCVEVGGKCLTNCLHQAIISDKPEIYKALTGAGATQKDHQSHEKTSSILNMIIRNGQNRKKEMSYYAMQCFSIGDARAIAGQIFSEAQCDTRYDEHLVLLLDRCDTTIQCALVYDLIRCDNPQLPKRLGAKVVEYILSHISKEDLKKHTPYGDDSFHSNAFHRAHGMTDELSYRLVKNGFYPSMHGLHSKIETLKVILEERGETFDTSTVYTPDDLRCNVNGLVTVPITPFKLKFFEWVVTTSGSLIRQTTSVYLSTPCITVMEKILASIQQAAGGHIDQFWRAQMSLSKLVGYCISGNSLQLPASLLNLGKYQRGCGSNFFYRWCLFYPFFLTLWAVFQRVLPVRSGMHPMDPNFILGMYQDTAGPSSGKDISFFRQISLIADKASFHADDSPSTRMTLIREGKYRRNLPRNTGSFIPSLFSLVPFDRALEIWTLTSLHVLETSNEENLIGRIPKEILFHIFWFMVPKIPLIFYQNPDETMPFYDLEYPF